MSGNPISQQHNFWLELLRDLKRRIAVHSELGFVTIEFEQHDQTPHELEVVLDYEDTLASRS